ncbi:unnamed protein product [Gongylonema pulchrum]|uniref:Ammonium_transp domain-containing protein n=1 Tax=Gongylonema pulchrum TaxID=637853 RepID=A0A183EBQ1_9BILA|nr:unnamed protein product [Gongylonema pulchrum]
MRGASAYGWDGSAALWGCVIYQVSSMAVVLSMTVQSQVFPRTAPQSSERLVLLNGEVNSIVDCIAIIIDVLKEIPIKGPIRPYDPMYYDPDVIGEYGGYVPDRNFVNRVGPRREYDFGASGMVPAHYPAWEEGRYGGMREMMGRYSPIPAVQTTQVASAIV